MKCGLPAAIVALSVAGLFLILNAAEEVNAQPYYLVSVTIFGFPPTLHTNVFLDGFFNGTMAGGETRVYNFSSIPPITHTITVDVYVPGAQGRNGTRYVNRVNSWSFNGPASHEFEYDAQHFLTVESEYGTTTGQGWYDEGDVAVATVSPSEISTAPGSRVQFKGWGGDASGSGLRSNDIVMDRPKKALAIWRVQYLLTINVNPVGIAQPSGAGWKDAGSKVTFAAPDLVQSGTTARFVFTSWTGDFSGQSASGEILMDGPKTVMANYRTQYLLTVKYNPPALAQTLNLTGQGWHDALTTVAVGAAPGLVEISSVERLVFDGWIDNGNRLGPSNTISVYMDQAHTVEVVYHRQFYLRIISRYGETFGEGWYDEGSIARFGIESVPSEWMVRYEFKGWNVSPQTSIESAGQLEWQIRVDKPYTLEAVWAQNYTPLITAIGGLGAVGALVIVGTVFALRHRGLGLPRGPGRLGRKAEGPSAPVPTSGMKSCFGCGARIPAAALFCHFCGRNQETQTAPAAGRGPIATELDDRVFDYIVAREGVISLSKAAQDLGVSVDELRASTDRLKKAGRIS